jgi:hypothetical protein
MTSLDVLNIQRLETRMVKGMIFLKFFYETLNSEHINVLRLSLTYLLREKKSSSLGQLTQTYILLHIL